MPEPPREPDDDAPRPAEVRFSTGSVPNTIVYDADTASPPRILPSSPINAPAPEPRAAAHTGVEHVAHFRVLGKIGEGGMGVVYRANDEYLQRVVALKVLSRGTSDSADVENTQRLLREARAASRISHPNVVTVFAAGEADGHAFIAMEYVEGVELAKLIGPSGLETSRALDVAAQVAEGLGAAHAQGIVHRDIKPANVLVCAGDRVKILDFGLAKPGRVDEEDRPHIRSPDDLPDSADALGFYHTQAGVIWGSLRYMSPEQFSGEHVGAASDVFSLGIVLFQLLTGTLPFVGRSPREQLAAVLGVEPAPLKSFRMRTSDAVQSIVDRALAKEPNLRYSSAEPMAADLRMALRRLRDLGDVEIEDSNRGSRRLASTAPPEPLAPLAPVPVRRAREVIYGPDSITYFPDGSQFEAVLLSPNVYPWTPRGARLPGGGSGGSAVNIAGVTYEVVAADRQNAMLNRYFLGRWPENTLVRRVFEYSSDTAAHFAASSPGSRAKNGDSGGSFLSGLFGKRRRDT